MCYNCGCGMPDDDMGKGHLGVDPNGKYMTSKTVAKMAADGGMSPEDVLQNIKTTIEMTKKKAE